MGSSLDGFNIKLEFERDGTVEKITYWDQEGCGHEAPVAPNESMADVVQYHLGHYRRGHRLSPPVGCTYFVKTQRGDRLTCVLGEHGPEVSHRFELKGE